MRVAGSVDLVLVGCGLLGATGIGVTLDRFAAILAELRAGESVEHDLGRGASELFASFALRARRESGRNDVPRRFHRAVPALPPARDTAEAVDDLVGEASVAADRDLVPDFRDRRGFPAGAEVAGRVRAGLSAARDHGEPSRADTAPRGSTAARGPLAALQPQRQ